MLSYNNTLIVPTAVSTIKSRFSNEIDTSIDLNGLELKLPLISAPMDSIDNPEFFQKIKKLGGIGTLHRFMSIDSQIKIYKNCPQETIVAVGTKPQEFERFKKMYFEGARNFIIDVANGFSTTIIPILELIKSHKCWVITGAVADVFGYRWLQLHESEAIRIGIGSGSQCSTRNSTGIGFPPLQGISDSLFAKKYSKIIADGGIKEPSDLAKALFVGADAVMIGRLFSHCVESKIGLELGMTREYRGMASRSVRGNIRGIEGKESIIKVDRTINEVFKDFDDGLRSCMSYLNARKISEMKNGGRIVQTPLGLREGYKEGG